METYFNYRIIRIYIFMTIFSALFYANLLQPGLCLLRERKLTLVANFFASRLGGLRDAVLFAPEAVKRKSLNHVSADCSGGCKSDSRVDKLSDLRFNELKPSQRSDGVLKNGFV